MTAAAHHAQAADYPLLWVVLIVAAAAIGGRVIFYLRIYTWLWSQKSVKDMLEAHVLWAQFKRRTRR